MFQIGTASIIINNELGTYIQSATKSLKATKIRDDLEANALFLKEDSTSVMFISCDLAGLESDVAKRAREAISESTGIDPRSVMISCTHMHSGPSLIPTNYHTPLDEDYINRLIGWLAELGKTTVDTAKEARIGWALGEAQIGYNRRCCWADGSHSMHGDTARDDFAGLEGPDDPAHFVLYAEDAAGELMAVLYNNTTHPTNFFSQGIYSADFPGRVRDYLRDLYGPIPVLFINGAFGDISINNLMSANKQKGSSEIRMERVAHLVAGETLRLYNDAEFTSAPKLGHVFEDLQVDVQLPTPDKLESAREVLARVDAGETIAAFDIIFAFGAVLLQERFGDNPVDILPIHAIRIGEALIVTQPCELYCQFGLDIKRRSPAKFTAVAGITDGYNGYCPTIAGVLGGGYSSEPINWTRLEPNAGYLIVETAGRLMNKLWG